MFVKLTNSDRDRLLEYVSAEPEPNLFIIGDIENYGLEGETVSVYANETDGGWDSVVLYYFDNRVIYARREDYDARSLAEFLKTEDFGCLSGKGGIVERVAAHIPGKELNRDHLACCRAASEMTVSLPEGFTIRRLTEGDIDAMIEMNSHIEEFARTYDPTRADKQREALRLSFAGGDINIGAFRDGKLVAGAGTSAKNSLGAMIVSVSTLPEYRGRGLATAVVHEVCVQAFACGLSFLFLFYDNPDAGRIYHRAGFTDIGDYAMLV